MSGIHVYFGGTFDPPHLGHQGMLEALLNDAWVSQVHVVPTGRNPLKSSGGALGDRELRKHWMQLWLHEAASVASGKLALENIEIDHEEQGPQYTVDTLAALKARVGGEWALCLGADIVKDLPRWRDVRALLAQLHSIWVFARGDQADPLRELDAELRALAEFRVMGTRVADVSSTQVRSLLRGDNALQKIREAPLLPSIKQNLEELARKGLSI